MLDRKTFGGGGGTIGDGTVTPAKLSFDPATQAELDAVAAAKQSTSAKGAASGYAGLDGSALVPKAQLPTLAAADLNADVASQAELDTEASTRAAADTALGAADTALGVRATFLEGAGVKQVVLAASTGNVTVSGPGATMDGVTLANGDRVLLKMQTAPADNGIYVFNGAASPLTRATDADAAGELANGCVVTVLSGAVNPGTRWSLVYPGAITLGTTALRFTRIFPAYEVPTSGPGGRLHKPTGAKIENHPREQSAMASVSALNNGKIRVNTLGVLRAGDTLSSVTFYSNGAGSSLTHRWGGIGRVSDLKALALSADDTSASWAATTPQTFTFTSPFTADVDEHLYALLMVAGTVPTLIGINTNTLGAMLNAGPIFIGEDTTTGRTTTAGIVGTTLTLAALQTDAYCYGS